MDMKHECGREGRAFTQEWTDRPGPGPGSEGMCSSIGSTSVTNNKGGSMVGWLPVRAVKRVRITEVKGDTLANAIGSLRGFFSCLQRQRRKRRDGTP